MAVQMEHSTGSQTDDPLSHTVAATRQPLTSCVRRSEYFPIATAVTTTEAASRMTAIPGCPEAGATSAYGPIEGLRLKGRAGLAHRMFPYEALLGPTYCENSHSNHTWHPPCIKPLVSKAWKSRPCGFDSHRPLHFQASSGYVGICDMRLGSRH